MMNTRTFPPLSQNAPYMLHGGDYNPEQWPKETWDEDSNLMGQAHWNIVTLGVFSWSVYEPQEGVFEFGWLDKIMDIQAASGRRVCLATPSAAAPAWLSRTHPETLRVGSDRRRKLHGNRVNYCWTSTIYREKARNLARILAERYKDHPALAIWHVSNELGGECYCDLCQRAFREWLKNRYVTVDALNDKYWATFWSHRVSQWDEIEAPGEPVGDNSITCLALDWRRFVSDQMVSFYRNEADVLREITPNIPVTTNLMGAYPALDPFKIAPHMDFASWDSYPWFSGTQNEVASWQYTAFCHDLNRSLKGGQPFLLMECAPSCSNWYTVMNLKRPGVHVLEGLQAVAHGSDGVCYFQWRQGRGSGEQFHGAVVAHNARSDARVFKDVASLGEKLEKLAEVTGASTPSKIGLIYDWENSWAIGAVVGPRAEKRDYLGTVLAYHRALWDRGIPADIIEEASDFSGYKLLVAPMLFLLKPGVAESLASFVSGGGTLITSYWSGVVDENCLAFVGGYPKPLRDILGIWSEEIDALYDGQTNRLLTEPSSLFEGGKSYGAADLCEIIHAETAEVLARYDDQFYAGTPALTRNRYGEGQAFFVASRNEDAFTSDLLSRICKQIGIEPCVEGSWPSGVTVQTRNSQNGQYLFVLNCSDREVLIEFKESGLTDVFTGSTAAPAFKLPAFGTRVLVKAPQAQVDKSGAVSSALVQSVSS